MYTVRHVPSHIRCDNLQQAVYTRSHIIKEKFVSEVDHTVSIGLWEQKLRAGLPARIQDRDDAMAVANQLGNCTLLEKNFNISKNTRSMESFLEQIYEYKEQKLSLRDWERALAMPNDLIDSKVRRQTPSPKLLNTET